MRIAIKEISTGKIYTNSMNPDNPDCILELHFCTSYTQAIIKATVQDIKDGLSKTRDLFLKAYDAESYEGSWDQAFDFEALPPEGLTAEWVEK